MWHFSSSVRTPSVSQSGNNETIVYIVKLSFILLETQGRSEVLQLKITTCNVFVVAVLITMILVGIREGGLGVREVASLALPAF